MLGAVVPMWVERGSNANIIIFSCVAGVICQGWGLLGLLGVLGLCGFRCQVGIVLTLSAISLVLLFQVILRWMSLGGDKTGCFVVTILLTVMLLVTLVFLGWMISQKRIGRNA